MDRLKKIHWLLVINVIVLFCICMAVQYSSDGGKWVPFAIHQKVIFSLFFLLAMARARFLFEARLLFYIAAAISLLAVNFFGSHIMGATRWIKIGSISLVGNPLPFLSYGGSTTAASLICIGLLLAIKADEQQNACISPMLK